MRQKIQPSEQVTVARIPSGFSRSPMTADCFMKRIVIAGAVHQKIKIAEVARDLGVSFMGLRYLCFYD